MEKIREATINEFLEELAAAKVNRRTSISIVILKEETNFVVTIPEESPENIQYTEATGCIRIGGRWNSLYDITIPVDEGILRSEDIPNVLANEIVDYVIWKDDTSATFSFTKRAG